MRRAETVPRPHPAGSAHQHGRRGLHLAVLGAVLLALAALGAGPAAKQDVAALPAKVREALDRAASVYKEPLTGARWSKVHLLRGTEHPLYQLRGTNHRGNKIEMEVTSAGRVIEVEEHGIPIDEVPAAVVDALKARMPHFKPTQVEAIYQAEQARPVSYGFEGNDAGTTIEIYISADGKTFLN